MKNSNFLITFICVFMSLFIYGNEDLADSHIESMTEALKSPYQYQTVNVITGAYCENHTDLSLNTTTPLDLRRHYTSQDPLAQGWHFNHPNILHAEGEILDEWTPDPLRYLFDDSNRLTGIAVSTEESTAIHLHYKNEANTVLEIKTEDNQQISYSFETCQTSRATHPYILTQVKDDQGKEVHYNYIDHPIERRLLLNKREESNGRYLITEYYDGCANNVGGKIVTIADPIRDPRIGRVKLQKAPVGHDETPIITNRFFYEPGYTEVYDALGNKTLYRYENFQKLTAIEHYWNKTTLYRKERIFWNTNGQMTSRTIEDGSGTIQLLRTYHYDAYGNIIKTTVWGNLSGSEAAQIQISFNGQPCDDSIENYSTCYTFSDDGKYLIRESEDNGLITHYRYIDGKLAAKAVADNHSIHHRYFYHYNDEGVVTEEIEDDGSSFIETDLSQVTERRFTRIFPRSLEPAKGKPEIIERGFLNLDSFQEELLAKVELDYSENGEVIRKTTFDADLNVTDESLYDYDRSGRLLHTFSNTQDETHFFEYDLHGNIVKLQEEDSEIRQAYDFANRLIKKERWKDEELIQNFSYQYDYAGNIIVSTDGNGNETHYEYDPIGRQTKTILPAILDGDNIPVHPTLEKHYDIFNRVTRSIDSKGYCTQTCYNVHGKPTVVIHPDGSRELFEYYLDGSLKRKTSKNRSFVYYHRDPYSRVTKEEHFDRYGHFIGEKTFAYSSFHLISETNMEGCTTHYTYDGAGRPTHVSRENHSCLEITYDEAGQIASKKEWYDEELNAYVLGVIERNDQQEAIVMTLKNSEGEVVHRRELSNENTDENQIFEDEQYYNALGQNVLKRTEVDPKGETTTTIFDALNQPVSIERRDSLGTLLTHKEIRYDLSGNKEHEIHHIQQKGHESGIYSIHWSWGPENRLEKVTEGYETQLARTTIYSYNREGLLEKTLKPDNVFLSFTYNSNGAVKELKSSDLTVDYSYFYNEAGRIVEVIDNISGTSTQRAYNQFGQVISETLANDLTLDFDYDFLGRLKDMTLPDQSGVHWDYTAAYLSSITRTSNNGETLYTHTCRAYDLQGRLLESEMICDLGSLQYTYKKGDIAAITSPYWSQWLEFDNKNRLKSLVTEDPLEQITSSFTYNTVNQIVEETGISQHSFSYDSIGNLAALDGYTCTVDSLNQLIDTGTYAMKYDQNGQLIECWEEESLLLFNYDALGRLMSVKKDKESLVAFSYDPFGRRLSKEVSKYHSKDHTYIPTNSELYIWEGENEIGAVNSYGEISQFRMLGLGLGAEMGASVAIELNHKLYAPLHDHRGNISCLIDTDSGLPAEWYHYSAYGETHGFSLENSSLENPWKFSSKRVDEEIGLVYFGKRYYMPGIARWISKDPMGTPESINRYAFSLNQPLSRIDPYGLFSFGNLWNGFTSILDNAYHTIKSTKSKLSFEDYFRPTVTQIGEMVLGKTLLQLAGFYQDRSEIGVHGKGELNDKVRITLINGILNARLDYKQSLDIISNSHGGVNIHYLFDATKGWTNDMIRAGFSRMGYISSVSYQLTDMWRELIDEMGGIGEGGLIIHYAHSIGAAHTKNALSLLTPEERAMIRVYTFGSPTTISNPGLESVKNFISYRDGVPLLDPIGYFSGLLGLSDTIAMVGSPWGIPLIEHTLNGGAYYDTIRILGVHFMKHYVGAN